MIYDNRVDESWHGYFISFIQFFCYNKIKAQLIKEVCLCR